MKLLYIYTQPEFCVHEHIVNFLKEKGVEITFEPVNIVNSWGTDLTKFSKPEFIEKYKEINYDFILSAVHSTFPQIVQFQKEIKPKIGFIDIEHDLFANDMPEYSLSYNKSLLITFNKRHYATANRLLKNDRKIVRCRWIKLDANYPKVDFDSVDMWTDAILIGTGMWEGQDFSNIPYFKEFRKVWYKKYEDCWEISGVNILPKQFVGPLGSKYCADACKFFITQASSCYQDALLFGSIPLLLPSNIIKAKQEDDILSTVEMKVWMPPGISPLKAIVVDKNIGEKLHKLRNSISLFNEVKETLFLEWFAEDHYSLPSAHEIIYNFMSENYI